MTDSFIQIRRCPYEEPHVLNLRIFAKSGNSSGSLEFYCSTSDLIEVGTALYNYSGGPKSEFLWELGSEQPDARFVFFFKFRVFPVDGAGHSAIQIRLNNNESSPDQEISDFCLRCEPAQINRLGTLLLGFSKLTKLELWWDIQSGELRDDDMAHFVGFNTC